MTIESRMPCCPSVEGQAYVNFRSCADLERDGQYLQCLRHLLGPKCPDVRAETGNE